jgi:hypothetical protein
MGRTEGHQDLQPTQLAFFILLTWPATDPNLEGEAPATFLARLLGPSSGLDVSAVHFSGPRFHLSEELAQAGDLLRRVAKLIVKPRGETRHQGCSALSQERAELVRFEVDVPRNVLEPLGAEASLDLRLQQRCLAFLFI